ncbi:hypothetical protein V5735_03620 (plasmid) [Haladaptatus sp. SPP-AMP-3]|uniref:hypothetical protein n=1 Tax=Haladaptatus sp. SPP-AMP-3 TaxID=3121295 RepID=UPI003C2C99BE
MSKKDVVEYMEAYSSDENQQVVTAEDLDTTPECAHCKAKMPYADFNEHSPTSDYIIHVLPGEDEHTEPAKILYCSTRCLIQQREKML